VFEALQGFLPGKEEPSYQQVANALNLSVGAPKTAIHRLRGRYGAPLREEVARTVSAPAEVDEELRYLRTTLGAKTARKSGHDDECFSRQFPADLQEVRALSGALESA